MKRVTSVTLILLGIIFFLQPLVAQTKEPTGILMDKYATLDLRHRLSYTEGANELLRRALVGDFSVGIGTHLIRTDAGELNFYFRQQSLYGGFNHRRAKIYAANYFITLEWKQYLPDNWYVSLGSIHQSTHVADSIEVDELQELMDLREMRFDLEDINLFRLSTGQLKPNYAWTIGLQPVKLNYFLFAEFNRMFNHESYDRYEKLFYYNVFATIWKTESDRVALNLEGEAESGIRGIIKLSYSTRLNSRNPYHDEIQFYIAHEDGVGKNTIKATSYTGISTNRWLIGGHFEF